MGGFGEQFVNGVVPESANFRFKALKRQKTTIHKVLHNMIKEGQIANVLSDAISQTC